MIRKKLKKYPDQGQEIAKAQENHHWNDLI